MDAGVNCYPSPGKAKGRRLCEAFAAGCGGSVMAPGDPVLHPGAAFFYGWTEHSVPLISCCIDEGRDWYYADNAYYFGRGLEFRVTRNGYMHSGVGSAPATSLTSRGIAVAPWQTGGAHIVIATQSELFYEARLNVSRETWTAGVIAELQRHTAREIVVCHKPDARSSGNAAAAPGFESALVGAHALVVHSSSAAVKALADGVPVFPLGDCMASVMGYNDLSLIEAPYYPTDRKRWLRVLMANQWSEWEFRSGAAWRALRAKAGWAAVA